MFLSVGKCLLQNILDERKLTQQDLANMLVVTKQQINSYCTNRRVMTLEVALNVCIALNCEITDLYTFIEYKRRH